MNARARITVEAGVLTRPKQVKAWIERIAARRELVIDILELGVFNKTFIVEVEGDADGVRLFSDEIKGTIDRLETP